MKRRRLALLSAMPSLVIGFSYIFGILLGIAKGSVDSISTLPPPLPVPKGGFGTPSDNPQLVCCIYGYVIWDGKPVAGATVTLSRFAPVATTQTVTNAKSPYPSYNLILDEIDLGISLGVPMTVTATYNGQAKSIRYIPQESGQPVDVVIAQSNFDCGAVNTIPKSECEALVAIYDSLNGPGWTNNGDWLRTINPCAWAGVLCVNGHVSQVVLSSNALIGTIPPEIDQLLLLSKLDLHGNHITSSIPPELSALSNLIELDLSQNQLSGSVLNSISNLINLQTLKLSANQLSGAIPFEFIQLQRLTTLDLGDNALAAFGDNLQAFLRAKDPDWGVTQTIAPTGFQVLSQANQEFLLRWTPITNQIDSSYYEVSMADGLTSKFTVLASQIPITNSSYFLTGLHPQKSYSVRIRTYTQPHTLQINGVWSVFSPILHVQSVSKIPILALAAGRHHTCAVMSIGKVKCWGGNGDGQLGDNTTEPQLEPIEVKNMPGPVAQLTAGSYHTCAATFGKMQCWGDEYYAQLGDGRTNQNLDRLVPVEVWGLNHDVVSMSAGVYHTCAVLANGDVKCWGVNGHKQIGVSSGIEFATPTDVIGLSTGARMVAAGGTHNCVVLADGGVMCWGGNGAGQLGNGVIDDYALPGNVPGFGAAQKAVSVAAGAFYSCALTNLGAVYCWGDNEHGQIGNGQFDVNNDILTPTLVSSLSAGVTAIAGGDKHICALLNDASVQCWGHNGQGQLGDAKNFSRSAPVPVPGLGGAVTAIAAGQQHTCAALAAGGVKCWGDNVDGQIGDGTKVSRTTPSDVKGFDLPPDPLLLKKWAFLIYAVGDNNLDSVMGDYPAGMMQRLRSMSLPDNVSVAVLYDGAGNHGTQRYIFRPSGTTTMTLPETQMDISDTLQSFVQWGMSELPADYYYLAILDHANGVVGIGYDDTTNGPNQAYLEPQEIHAALKHALKANQNKLSIVHFDGCSFGLFEDTSIVYDLTDYVIASPNTGWGIFAYDQYARLAGQIDNEPRQLAQNIAKTYANRLIQNNSSPIPYTISVFDMAHYTPTKDAFHVLGNRLVEYLQTDSQRAQLHVKRDNYMQKYDSDDYRITLQDHYVDAYSLANALQTLTDTTEVPLAASAVSASINNFVVMELHSSGTFTIPFTGVAVIQELGDTHGLGIYYPAAQFSEPGAYRNYVENRTFPELTTNWGWTQFLRRSLPDPLPGVKDIPALIPPFITPAAKSSQLYLPVINR